MSAIIEIELKELDDGQASMFFRLYGENATKMEIKTARNIMKLLGEGVVTSGGKEIAREDFDLLNPIIGGKN